MLWRGERESENVEDERRSGGGRIAIGGGIGGVILVVAYLLLGGDPQALLDSQSQSQSPQSRQLDNNAPRDDASKFVAVVLADTEDAWHTVFRQMGRQYEEPKLVLFSGQTRSGCGFASSASGPFYCPEDRRVYIDLSFYQMLRERFGAPGDFAQAYVIAHEIGHHVQHQLGISDRVRSAQEQRPDQANALSVRLELQADCLAGVWGNSTEKRNILEAGDADEALAAAAAIGDDRIQRGAGAGVNPETWTHGSSRQRVAWFKHGLESGRLDDCDTFKSQLPEER
jgi:predicted metalloprotease